jgi:hypothetical protein
VRAIADGTESPPSWTRIAGVSFVVRLLSRSWRKVLITYFATERARAAAHTFQVATLFDHYCARVHVGLGLDAAGGKRVRAAIDRGMSSTEGGLLTRSFRRGVGAAARASVRAPAELLDLVSGGALRRLLARGETEVRAVAEMDDAIERSMAEETGFLHRAAAAIEAQVSAEANPYLDTLLSNFETLWRDDA